MKTRISSRAVARTIRKGMPRPTVAFRIKRSRRSEWKKDLE